MAAVETYLRVVLAKKGDAIKVQQSLSQIAGYIGSYTVDFKSIGGKASTEFHIVIGFNGSAAQVDEAVEKVKNDDRVTDVLEIRNRNQVTPLILAY
jgi:hypothetical protein